MEVTYQNHKLYVEYTVTGKYIPATREQSEEYPDYIIDGIYLSGTDIDIKECLTEKQEDEIWELICEQNS